MCFLVIPSLSEIFVVSDIVCIFVAFLLGMSGWGLYVVVVYVLVTREALYLNIIGERISCLPGKT